MGYALFAQRKLVLDAQLNSAQLQQTQRSNEQYNLATQTTNLQMQLTSLSSAESTEKADLYEILSATNSDGGFDESDSNYDNYVAIAVKYGLSEDATRDQINAKINQIEAEYEVELNTINNKIYQVSLKENRIEMEVKSLDTQVTSLEKQLEAVEEAESDAIDRATPKFNGVG